MYFNKIKLFSLNKKLKEIKLILMDFDGVFTDGGIFLGNNGTSFRRFDVKDGLGIKLLKSFSIQIGCISGSNSDTVKKRCDNLNIDFIEMGVEDKSKKILEIKSKLKLNKNNILFLGDDINDLTVIPYVNLFIVPSDAHKACKAKASYISSHKGGNGFIREIADLLLISKGFNPYKEFKTRNEFSD